MQAEHSSNSVPPLKKTRANGKGIWEPRDCEDVSAELSACYGLPIDVSPKAAGLAAVACALNEGSIARAQLAALFLRFPDPPPLTKDAASRNAWIAFIHQLSGSNLLKWDEDKHPRWPAGALESQGGRFAPKGEEVGGQSRPVNTPDANIPNFHVQHDPHFENKGDTPQSGTPGFTQIAARGPGKLICPAATMGAVAMCAAAVGAVVLCPETGISCAIAPEAGKGCVAGTALALGICRSLNSENPIEREQRCQENLDRDLETCQMLGRQYGKKAYRICEQQAMLRYGNCLAGRDGDDGINAPLPPWGR